MKKSKIYLSLGSNLGQKKRNLNRAIEHIKSATDGPFVVSGIYESDPWGYESDHAFFNCCLSAYTDLDPLQLLEALLSIEKGLGRTRGNSGYSDRLIDIDLLFYGELVFDHLSLKIPHPAIQERRFVLEPLSEIAPDLIHPVMGLNILELLKKCTDPGRLKILTSG